MGGNRTTIRRTRGRRFVEGGGLSKYDYRADIDGLRAIAVLAVIAYHVNPLLLPGGFVGVDLFFVVSGYVVSASLAAAPTTGFLGFLSFFYARRLARIVPALVVTLLITALLTTLFVPNAWLSGFSHTTLVAAFFGVSNWVLHTHSEAYFTPRAEFNAYTHTWSLGVEEQFYVLLPPLIYLFFASRLARVRALSIAAICLLAAISLVICIWTTTHKPAFAFYSVASRFWELAAGVLLFQITSALSKTPKDTNAAVIQYLNLAAPYIGLTCTLLALYFSKSSSFPWPGAALGVAGVLLLIGGVRADTRHPIRKVLSYSPIRWVGERSYSLYLWHWPVFVLLRWTLGFESISVIMLALAATFVLASLSFRYIETPFRRSLWLTQRAPIFRIALFLLLIAGGAIAAIELNKRRALLSQSVVERNLLDWQATHQMPPALANSRKCSTRISYDSIHGAQVIRYSPVESDSCSKQTKKIAVIGDSHAIAYAPLFDQLSAETGYAVDVYSYPGCSYLGLRDSVRQTFAHTCLDFTNNITTSIAKNLQENDIVFLPSLRMLRFSDQWATFDQTQVQTQYDRTANPSLRKNIREEAEQWLRVFSDRGIKILFEAPKPVFKSPPFRCSDWFNRLNPICDGGISIDRVTVETLRAPVLATQNQLQAALPGIFIWDPLPHLCDTTKCDAFTAGRPLFFDGDHVSGYGNQVLYPSFKEAIYRLESHSVK
jgi:peptidoglycan/LPS O-acetylase OafA/YrhL